MINMKSSWRGKKASCLKQKRRKSGQFSLKINLLDTRNLSKYWGPLRSIYRKSLTTKQCFPIALYFKNVRACSSKKESEYDWEAKRRRKKKKILANLRKYLIDCNEFFFPNEFSHHNFTRLVVDILNYDPCTLGFYSFSGVVNVFVNFQNVCL